MNRTYAVVLPDQAPRGKLWLGAAAIAVVAHLSFAALAIASIDDEDDADLGAPGVEIALEIVSPEGEASQLPVGPESDASAASAPQVEQEKVKSELDLPKETPVESDNPDRLVAVQPPQPDARDQQPTDQVEKQSEAATAREAAAPPVIPDAVKAEKSTVPEQGTGRAAQRDRVTWQKELLAHLDKYKRYPPDRSSKDAEVVVVLDLDRMGAVVSARIGKSSGDAVFDAAALSMVQHASPVPPPPLAVADAGLKFSLPVAFHAHGPAAERRHGDHDN